MLLRYVWIHIRDGMRQIWPRHLPCGSFLSNKILSIRWLCPSRVAFYKMNFDLFLYVCAYAFGSCHMLDSLSAWVWPMLVQCRFISFYVDLSIHFAVIPSVILQRAFNNNCFSSPDEIRPYLSVSFSFSLLLANKQQHTWMDTFCSENG